jgi:hypothetical protein
MKFMESDGAASDPAGYEVFSFRCIQVEIIARLGKT